MSCQRKIVKTGGAELAKELEAKGYAELLPKSRPIWIKNIEIFQPPTERYQKTGRGVE